MSEQPPTPPVQGVPPLSTDELSRLRAWLGRALRCARSKVAAEHDTEARACGLATVEWLRNVVSGPARSTRHPDARLVRAWGDLCIEGPATPSIEVQRSAVRPFLDPSANDRTPERYFRFDRVIERTADRRLRLLNGCVDAAREAYGACHTRLRQATVGPDYPYGSSFEKRVAWSLAHAPPQNEAAAIRKLRMLANEAGARCSATFERIDDARAREVVHRVSMPSEYRDLWRARPMEPAQQWEPWSMIDEVTRQHAVFLERGVGWRAGPQLPRRSLDARRTEGLPGHDMSSARDAPFEIVAHLVGVSVDTVKKAHRARSHP